MKELMLHLSKDFAIPVTEYAIQGNAVLGIREAGKTYTAMKAAEELLDNGVPIIVYDPVGIWKNLKVGTGKHKGYPIVVAGGAGSDIILTTKNAVDIVRAAMKENVSLVIDLYTPELANKSSWIKIVQETVEMLFLENIKYGLRHIFIEEAAEFIPQKVEPHQRRVYSAIERIARMGRNSRLGYTIINQRAEEVNKAILEICAFSLLHKQVGKNSLNSIKKWLELRQLNNTDGIIKSLPTLGKGECWAIGQTDQPQRVKISAKNTYHPDPRKDAGAQVQKVTVDVSGFVLKMNKQLQKEVMPVAVASGPAASGPAARVAIPDNTAALREEIIQLRQKIKEHEAAGRACSIEFKKLHAALDKIQQLCISFRNPSAGGDGKLELSWTPPAVTTEIKGLVPRTPSTPPRITPIGNLGKCASAIMQFLASYSDRSFTLVQIGVGSNYSPTSSGFANSMSELNTRGLIVKEGDRRRISNTSEAREIIRNVQPAAYSPDTFKNKLGKCEREIYEILLANSGGEFTKEELAAATPSGYSSTSSGFANSLSALNTLELIKKTGGKISLNPELLELM